MRQSATSDFSGVQISKLIIFLKVMPLTELFPVVSQLSHQKKLRLIHFLLGAVWEDQTVPIQLSGNLAQMESRGLVLSATVADFPFR